MKTADILALLDQVGIGIDHPEGYDEYCAYWPKEPGKVGIVIQGKPDELIKAVIQSFQAVYLAHSKRSNEFQEFKALVKQMMEVQKIYEFGDERDNLETQVDKYLQE